MLDYINQFITIFLDNLWIVAVMAVIAIEWNKAINGFIFEPLRGGNGITQMDELAKYMMIVYLGWMIVKEGATSEHVYYESWGWAMIVGVALIAGIKEFAIVLNKIGNK